MAAHWSRAEWAVRSSSVIDLAEADRTERDSDRVRDAIARSGASADHGQRRVSASVAVADFGAPGSDPVTVLGHDHRAGRHAAMFDAKRDGGNATIPHPAPRTTVVRKLLTNSTTGMRRSVLRWYSPNCGADGNLFGVDGGTFVAVEHARRRREGFGAEFDGDVRVRDQVAGTSPDGCRPRPYWRTRRSGRRPAAASSGAMRLIRTWHRCDAPGRAAFLRTHPPASTSGLLEFGDHARSFIWSNSSGFSMPTTVVLAIAGRSSARHRDVQRCA